MSKERTPIIERPLTSDEINEKMFRMMHEREKQDAEAEKRFTFPFRKTPDVAQKPIIERPLTSDEINEKMFRMMQERERYNQFPAPGY